MKGLIMKMLLNTLVIGLVGGFSLGAFRASADLEVCAAVQIHANADFEAPLAPHGAWIEVGSYGRCWRPAGVAVDWRPYCYGHWVWTDCGWYWASDEPWAWACYHYGWWVYDPVAAWVWVPGIEWAPAWVSWRVGGGFIGWAPFAPPGFILARHIAPSSFVFVEANRFHETLRPSTVIVNNTTIINKTTQITELKRETRSIDGAKPQKVVINEGPGRNVIQKATGREFRVTPIREAVRQTPLPVTMTGRPSEPPMPGGPPSRSSGPPRERGEGRSHGRDRF
jgi:hypothetical protein